MRTLVSFLMAVLAAGTASLARAQERPSAAVLATQASESVGADTSGAVDRMIRARLDGLDVVRTSSGVALDLSEVQLALGCVGETPECLGPVANELSVQLLLIPSLDGTDGELMLTIALFDREVGTIRRVVREASGDRARTDLLDSIEGGLRELFGLPAAPASEEHEHEAEPAPAQASSGVGPGSFIVMGAGVAAIAVAIGMSVGFLDAQHEWESARPTDQAGVDVANAAYDRAQTFGIAADVLYVVGGVAIAGGVAWLLVELLGGSSGSSESQTTVSPIVSPTTLGLVARGHWEAP